MARLGTALAASFNSSGSPHARRQRPHTHPTICAWPPQREYAANRNQLPCHGGKRLFILCIKSCHGRFGAKIRYQVLVLVRWCRVVPPYLALRRIGRIQSQVPLRPVAAGEYKSSKLSCRMKQPYPIPASLQYPNRAKRLVLILLIHPIAL
ncbi:hypothetical protein HDV64DRAFT_255950 [Trichoderma sp. TUCIM 5745]